MALYKTPSQPEIKRIQLESILKYQHRQRLFKLSRLKTRRNFHSSLGVRRTVKSLIAAVVAEISGCCAGSAADSPDFRWVSASR